MPLRVKDCDLGALHCRYDRQARGREPAVGFATRESNPPTCDRRVEQQSGAHAHLVQEPYHNLGKPQCSTAARTIDLHFVFEGHPDATWRFEFACCLLEMTADDQLVTTTVLPKLKRGDLRWVSLSRIYFQAIKA